METGPMLPWICALLGAALWGLQTHGAPPLLEPDDVVATLGGSRVVAADRSGHTETWLAATHPQWRLRWRSLAWEGDTVFTRPRELNFPGITNQLRTAGATVVLLQFGEMESFAGPSGIPQFVAAYDRLLGEVGAVVPRRVLVTPSGPGDSIAAGLHFRRDQIAAYALAVRELGGRLGIPVVDLHGEASPRSSRAEDPPAVRLAAGLAGGPVAAPTIGVDGRWEVAAWEHLREAIVARNRLWFDYTRPMNWAFLGGDRTDQPSSRDHRDRNLRWFPAEMEQFLPLIAAADATVWDRAAVAAGNSR